MPDSPLAKNIDLISLTIKVDGKTLQDDYKVSSIEVSKEVNRVPHAVVSMLDGDASKETFAISESDDFVPGAEIEILAGYREKEETIFKGLIMQHSIKVRTDKTSYLELTCKDKCVKMTVGRKSDYFLKQKDSAVIGKLIGAAGLQNDVEDTKIEQKEIIQYYSTDWDFIISRAEINGQIVCASDGKLSVKKPDVGASPELIITYGDEIREIEATIDAKNQLPSVSSKAWDMASQKMVEGTSQEPKVNIQGNLDGKKLAQVIGLASFDLQSTAPISEASLKSWANAQLLKSRLARIQGTVSFQGNAEPLPGKTIELAGLGKRFNGVAFISGVRHTILEGEWETEVAFGLSPNWFVEEQSDVEAPLTAGLLPGISGLHIGIVKKIHEDPDGETRVQVDIPTIAPTGDGVWARLSNLYATNKAGTFFMPEVQDEVILGFLNDDPRFPVILGSLYSSKHTSPYTPDEKNTIKAIVTNSQMKIWFDEEKKIIQIETPGGQVCTLSDDEKSITLTDSNKNKIEMSSSGILLDSPKDISLTAKGKITLDATAGMKHTSKADFSLEGLNLNAKAKIALTAEGQASATFKAAGNVTVQGAMVMIN